MTNLTAASINAYFFTVLSCAMCGAVGIVLIFFSAVLIKRQVKLYNSITLVKLKSGKIRYIVILAILGILEFYVFTQIFDENAPELKLAARLIGAARWQVALQMSFAAFVTLCAMLLIAVLAFSRCAVVDRGVYTSFRFIDWYHVHDYIIDEDDGTVVLSANKRTFMSLLGTTAPMRVAKNDVDKLKFILNKNKNKFSGVSIDKL